MPTTLTAQTISRTVALDLATATAADATGNNWANTGVERLFIFNGGAGAITLTHVLGTGGVVDSLVPAARTTSIAAGQRIILGPWPGTTYNDATGKMSVTWSAVTTVSVMVLSG